MIPPVGKGKELTMSFRCERMVGAARGNIHHRSGVWRGKPANGELFSRDR